MKMRRSGFFSATLWFHLVAIIWNIKMSAQGRVLALDEGKAEARRERGRTHRSINFSSIVVVVQHL